MSIKTEEAIARGVPFVYMPPAVPIVGEDVNRPEFQFERVNFGEIEEKLKEYHLFGDRVLIRQLSVEQIGEIALPDLVQHTSAKIYVGVVVKVGADCQFVEAKDVVFYPKYASSDVPWMGVDFLIIANEPNLWGECNWEERKWRID